MPAARSPVPLAALRASLVAALLSGLAGCPTAAKDTADTGSTPSPDGDADTDADTDSDTDTDTDSDTDADTDSDTDADTDSDTDSDTDTDSGTPPDSGTDTGTSPVGCGGVDLLDARGLPSGLVQCPDGSIDRATQETCDPAPPALPACSVAGGACSTDADCVGGPNGVCLEGAGYGVRGCSCVYTCEVDADCGAGNVCVCGGALAGQVAGGDWSHCAPAACAQDADCPSGECGVGLVTIGIGCPITEEFVCRTPTDTCRGEADCNPYDFCAFERGAGEWNCQTVPPLACGRPMTVDGALRLAPAAARPDWAAGPAPVGAASASLAAYWAAIGAMEHASVASFARFTLELMAQGAPPELLREAQQAGIDEIDHARKAYALARAYGAADAGPGPLPLGGTAVRTDRREVLAALVEEACVTETVAAAEVRAAAGLAGAGLAETLAGIASDEERHAALGWRALGWFLSTADAEERDFVAAAFERAVAGVLAAPAGELHAPEHGVIGGEAQRRLRRQVVAQVLRPALARALA